MTSRFLFAAIGAGAAFLALAWFANGYVIIAALIVLLGFAWLYAEARRKRWASFVGLAGATVCAGAAERMGLSPALLLPGLALALAAWDLSDFERRLDLAARPGDSATLEWTHHIRLGLVLMIGLALSEAALVLTGVHINFEWTLLFIFIGAWGLTTLIGWLRERGSG